ncbi:MAG: hypothetical protein ABEI52_02080 [Halobacteriaceae archaeon]
MPKDRHYEIGDDIAELRDVASYPGVRDDIQAEIHDILTEHVSERVSDDDVEAAARRMAQGAMTGLKTFALNHAGNDNAR